MSAARSQLGTPPEDLGLVEMVRTGVVDAVRSAGDVAAATVDTVTSSLFITRKIAGSVGASATDAVYHVVGGAIHGARGGHIDQVAKGTVIGVLRGTRHIGHDAIATIGQTAGAVIRHTAAVGGRIDDAATGLVEGAIHSAPEIGVSAEDAATAAAQGALEAADGVGAIAAKTVRHAVTQTIAGIKIALKAPFDHRVKTAAR